MCEPICVNRRSVERDQHRNEYWCVHCQLKIRTDDCWFLIFFFPSFVFSSFLLFFFSSFVFSSFDLFLVCFFNFLYRRETQRNELTRLRKLIMRQPVPVRRKSFSWHLILPECVRGVGEFLNEILGPENNCPNKLGPEKASSAVAATRNRVVLEDRQIDWQADRQNDKRTINASPDP